MISKLAPRPWQAAVVDQLEHAHNYDREHCRQCCWMLRFPLTSLHDEGVPAAAAAAWVARHIGEGPRVLSRRWGDSSHAVDISRRSALGNPFMIGKDGSRADVIATHEVWLRGQHHVLRALPALRGQDLVCFCAPLPCHGDLLLRLANGSREELIAWWRGAA